MLVPTVRECRCRDLGGETVVAVTVAEPFVAVAEPFAAVGALWECGSRFGLMLRC